MPEQTEPTTGTGGQQIPPPAAPDAQQQFVANAQPVADALRAGGQEKEAQRLEASAQVIANARKALGTTEANLKRMDDERDNFIRNAQPMADALRKSGKPVEAKQLEEAARVISQTKGMGPEQAGKVVEAAPAKEQTLKEIMDGVFAAIDKDPKLRNMPEAQGLRKATTALEKDGMLNITVRNGVVVSFASNFADNMSRTQKVDNAPAGAKQAPAPQQQPAPAVAAAAPAPSEVKAPTVAPVQAAPAPTQAAAPVQAQPFTAYPAYTNYAPSTETGIIESRKTTLAASPQMNVAMTDKGEFGINPQVNQQRLIGDGMASLSKFFDYEMPTSGFKIAHVSLAEPGQMKQTEKGWEVVTKAKLALTDTAGNVFKPELSAGRQAVQVAQDAPAMSQPVQVKEPALRAAEPAAQVTPFLRDEMPEALLAKLGVKLSDLEKSGQLEKLLQGKKTDLIEGFSLTGLSGEPIPFSAKLVMHRDDKGVATLKIDLPKHDLIIPKEIMGKQITPAMQVELQKNGVLPLTPGFTDGHGRPFSAYLGVDKQMNRVVAVRPEAMALNIPKEVLGVKLDPEISRQLLEGKATKLVGMTNSKQQVFDATVQLDPVKRQLTFREIQTHQVEQVQQVQQQQRRRGLGA